MSIRSRSILALLLLLVNMILPLLLWYFGEPGVFLSTPSQLFRALGQMSAIIGLTLFATEFVLSARLKIVEQLLSGLNRVYVWHHLIGGLAFIFLLFHPLFLGISYAFFSLMAATRFFIPSSQELGMWLGISALLTMIVLLFLTFFVRLKYERWKFTHQFLGIAFILAFAHTLTVPSVLNQNTPLKINLIVLYSLGTLTFIYTVVIKRYFLKKRRYSVVNTVQDTNETMEIKMKPIGEALRYQAGQFLFVTFKSLGVPTEAHPFSITSNPTSPLLSIAVKTLGDFTRSLQLLKPQDEVIVEGPYGHFSQEHIKNNQQIWIAGGIGVTPFLGMARSLESSDKDIWLFYSVKDATEAAFKTELAHIAARQPGFKLVIWETEKRGRLTMSQVAKYLPLWHNYDLLICGPLPMMQAIKVQAKTLGIAGLKIHTEEFALQN